MKRRLVNIDGLNSAADGGAVRSAILLDPFHLAFAGDTICFWILLFRTFVRGFIAGVRTVRRFMAGFVFWRTNVAGAPRPGAIIIIDGPIQNGGLSNIGNFNAVLSSERYRDSARVLGAKKSIVLSDFWTDAASDLATHQDFAAFRNKLNTLTRDITFDDTPISALMEPYIYSRYLLISRFQQALQAAHNGSEAIVLIGFKPKEILNSFWPLVHFYASDRENIWCLGQNGVFRQVLNPSVSIFARVAEGWISQLWSSKKAGPQSDTNAKIATKSAKSIDFLLVTDAPVRTPYWRAAVNLVEAATRRRASFRVAVLGNEAFYDLPRTRHVARRFSLMSRLVTRRDRQMIVAFFERIKKTGLQAENTVVDAAVLSDLCRPIVTYWIMRSASLYRQMVRFFEQNTIRSLVVLPHYSEFAVVARSVAEQFGVEVSGGPAVTIAPSVSSILGWEKIQTIFCYGMQCRNAFESMNFPRERLHLVGNMVLPALSNKSREKCLSLIRRKFRKFPAEREVVLVATSGIDPNESDWIEQIAEHADAKGLVTIVKVHPSLPVERYIKLANLVRQRILFVTNSIEIYDLIPLAKICVTDNSTVGAEAASLGKFLMVVNLTGKKFAANDYVGEGIALGVADMREMKSSLDSLLSDSPTRERLEQAKRKFAEAYNWPNDFAAPDHMIDLLCSRGGRVR